MLTSVHILERIEEVVRKGVFGCGGGGGDMKWQRGVAFFCGGFLCFSF
jgi:hypothetical protein